MDESCQSLISCCRSPPPHCLPDQKRLFTQSSSPWSGRNASTPPQPPCRDWQRRLKPNEPTLLEAPSWNATETSWMSSHRKPLPTFPLDHAIELHPDAKLPRGRTFPSPPQNRRNLMSPYERIWQTDASAHPNLQLEPLCSSLIRKKVPYT